MKPQIVAWTPALLWAGVLFAVSEVPDVPGDLVFPHADKLAHTAAYLVLGLTLAWGRFRGGPEIPHLGLVGAGAVYGVLDEVHQAFVPGRTPSPADVVFDALGVALGYVLFLRILLRGGEAGAGRWG